MRRVYLPPQTDAVRRVLTISHRQALQLPGYAATRCGRNEEVRPEVVDVDARRVNSLGHFKRVLLVDLRGRAADDHRRRGLKAAVEVTAVTRAGNFGRQHLSVRPWHSPLRLTTAADRHHGPSTIPRPVRPRRRVDHLPWDLNLPVRGRASQGKRERAVRAKRRPCGQARRVREAGAGRSRAAIRPRRLSGAGARATETRLQSKFRAAAAARHPLLRLQCRRRAEGRRARKTMKWTREPHEKRASPR